MAAGVKRTASFLCQVSGPTLISLDPRTRQKTFLQQRVKLSLSSPALVFRLP